MPKMFCLWSRYLSLLCVVQTPFKSARTVTDRIATFMSSFIASKLQTVSEVELQQLIGSLVAIRRMPPASSLQAEATAWAEIASQQYALLDREAGTSSNVCLVRRDNTHN
eukprot:INCI13429.13.p1 GENE.INCI13429.13~~INCI13429.13.p1  ORF type:complete len:110 (+),score=13.54 INCI13429.13:108-437(+)